MLSINTNISSIVAQRSMTTSTTKLNQAIERLTTGYKINHAGDNAANYSIATEMTSKINSCNVAQDNIGMGMNLVSVAQETVSQMQSRASKLHALITQARNGTYGETSLNAINLEAAALVAEIDRAYKNAEYDGISMIQKFKPEVPDGIGLTSELKPRDDGFLVDPKTYDDAVVNAMTHVKEINSFESGVTYAIGDLEDLIKFRTLVNGGQNGAGSTFVMCDDIDMSSIENWVPIGQAYDSFSASFDGNGHIISNLKQTINGNEKGSGLFFYCQGSVKNLGIINADINIIKGKNSGIICGHGGSVSNCFAKGNINASANVNILGGVVGKIIANNKVKNSYFEGNITGSATNVGGVCGYVNGYVDDCYAKGNISGKNNVGGCLGGEAYGAKLNNCFFNGNVSGESNVGGLMGNYSAAQNQNYIYNCEVSGSVSGLNNVGGIAGQSVMTGGTNITEGVLCKASVSGENNVGGLIGYTQGCNLNNCMMFGNVSGNSYVGGILGKLNAAINTEKVSKVINVSFYGDLTGTSNIGNAAGAIAITPDGTNFGAVNFSNCKYVESSFDKIGCTLQYADETYTPFDYDTTTWESNINVIKQQSTKITLQAGLDSEKSSQIKFDLGFDYDLNDILTDGCASDSAYTAINTFINTLSKKETEFGAVANKLDSALESVTVSLDNLVSSRSTILDADISKVSSDFIRQQILQQACATLMSTANQSPSIALQLL